MQSEGQHKSLAAFDNTEAELVAARLVAAAVAKACCLDEAEQKWRQEIDLLRRRAERSAKMEIVMEEQRQRRQQYQVRTSSS